MFPVLGGISGSKRTMCSIWRFVPLWSMFFVKGYVCDVNYKQELLAVLHNIFVRLNLL